MSYRVKVDQVDKDGNFLTMEHEVAATKPTGDRDFKQVRAQVLEYWKNRTVDIVVVVHDGARSAMDCINSILDRSPEDINWRLTVIDNASEKFTQEILAECGGIDQLLRMGEYEGHLPAMQIAFEQTKGEWVVFMDQRVVVTAGWLEAMLWAAQSGTRVSMVAPWTNKRIPAPAGSNYIATADAVRKTSKWDNQQTVFPGGHCFAIERVALKQCGGFDVDFYRPGYGETADLYMRLVNANRVAVRAAGCYILDETPGQSEAAEWMPNGGAGYSRFLARWGESAEGAYKSRSGKDGVRKVAGRMLSVDSKRPKVVFSFRELQLCGAVLAVAHICNNLIEMGWDATIAYTRVTPGHNLKYIPMRFTPMHLQSPSKLVQELRRIKGPTHMVGSIWTTVSDVVAVCDGKPEFTPWYFIQDDERRFRTPTDKPYANPKDIEATYAMIDRKIINSDWVVKVLADLGYPGKKIAIGVDPLMFHPRKRPTDRIRIMSHCRASTPRRGWDFIVESLNRAARSREFELVTFDETPEADTLSMPWRGNLGKVSPFELAQHLSTAHIFFEGSEFQGYGMTGLEAMSSGCALISSDNMGVHNYGTHGKDCLIVKYGDYEGAAGYICKLIDDVKYREELGIRARKVAELFAWERIAAEWDRVLRD